MGRRLTASVDWLLLLTVVGLLLFSIALVYSASAPVAASKFGSIHYFFWRQVLRVGLSIAMVLFVMHVDYRLWQRLAGALLWIGIALLFLTLVLSEPVKGAARWLQLGPIRFQPSEFVKFVVPLFIAARCSHIDFPWSLSDPAVRRTLLLLLLCCGLIAAQPNASAAGLLAMVTLLTLAAAGMPIRSLLLLTAVGFTVFVIYALMAPYRLHRILTFWSSWQGEIPYQVRQSLIAFGHGGLFGVGPGQSMQREFFLPEAYSDFIFAIIGEEYGLLGTTLVVLSFLIIVWRGLRIARRAPEPSGSIIAFGITCAIGLYALVHMGVTTGIVPVTGVPLPFLGYGGSSVFFSAAATGILLNIGRQSNHIPAPVPTPVHRSPL